MVLFASKTPDMVNISGVWINNSNFKKIRNIRLLPLKRFAFLFFFLALVFPKIFFIIADAAYYFDKNFFAGKNIANPSSGDLKELKNNPLAVSNIRKGGSAYKIGIPRRLVIPAISVDASVQSLGLRPNGEMEAPSNFKDAGWFNLWPRPGERGNAVISGHLDTDSGGAGVFWHLHRLKAGDFIFIEDEYGNMRRFKVTDTQIYGARDSFLQKIFSVKSNAVRLNLITCDGAWDKKEQNYTKRLVVSAEIAPE